MTFKKIISELKETDTKLRDSSLPIEVRELFARIELENLSMIDDTYNHFISLFGVSKEEMINGKFDNIGYNELILTFIFFINVTKALKEQFLADERKDIISLSASSNSKDKISLMLNNLINQNKLDMEYLNHNCLVEGIDMETSNEDEVYSIWFEINTLDLCLGKRRIKYTSGR